MITDADITKLKGTFATKRDLTAVEEDIADMKVELGEVHDTIDSMAAAIVRIENTLDGLAGIALPA